MKNVLYAALVALLLCSATTFAEEKTGKNEEKDEKVAIADLPKAVVDAVNAARPGGTIIEADKETAKDGTVVYEVDVKQGGKNYEVKVDASGKVLSNEEDKEDEKDEKKDVKKEEKTK